MYSARVPSILKPFDNVRTSNRATNFFFTVLSPRGSAQIASIIMVMSSGISLIGGLARSRAPSQKSLALSLCSIGACGARATCDRGCCFLLEACPRFGIGSNHSDVKVRLTQDAHHPESAALSDAHYSNATVLCGIERDGIIPARAATARSPA